MLVNKPIITKIEVDLLNMLGVCNSTYLEITEHEEFTICII